MDILCINQLMVMARIGVYDWERRCLQKLVFDIQVSCDNKFFVTCSNISFYLDYTKINRIILEIVNNKHFLLIENIAEIVSQTLIEKLCIISWIRIRVSKFNAIGNAYSVSVYIEREKKSNFNKVLLYTGWKK